MCVSCFVSEMIQNLQLLLVYSFLVLLYNYSPGCNNYCDSVMLCRVMPKGNGTKSTHVLARFSPKFRDILL